jgi:hypothetical protein
LFRFVLVKSQLSDQWLLGHASEVK